MLTSRLYTHVELQHVCLPPRTGTFYADLQCESLPTSTTRQAIVGVSISTQWTTFNYEYIGCCQAPLHRYPSPLRGIVSWLIVGSVVVHFPDLSTRTSASVMLQSPGFEDS